MRHPFDGVILPTATGASHEAERPTRRSVLAQVAFAIAGVLGLGQASRAQVVGPALPAPPARPAAPARPALPYDPSNPRPPYSTSPFPYPPYPPPLPPTTQALGEEGGVTTFALGEEGGVTTFALGEEGGRRPPWWRRR